MFIARPPARTGTPRIHARRGAGSGRSRGQNADIDSGPWSERDVPTRSRGDAADRASSAPTGAVCRLGSPVEEERITLLAGEAARGRSRRTPRDRGHHAPAVHGQVGTAGYLSLRDAGRATGGDHPDPCFVRHPGEANRRRVHRSGHRSVRRGQREIDRLRPAADRTTSCTLPTATDCSQVVSAFTTAASDWGPPSYPRREETPGSRSRCWPIWERPDWPAPLRSPCCWPREPRLMVCSARSTYATESTAPSPGPNPSDRSWRPPGVANTTRATSTGCPRSSVLGWPWNAEKGKAACTSSTTTSILRSSTWTGTSRPPRVRWASWSSRLSRRRPSQSSGIGP